MLTFDAIVYMHFADTFRLSPWSPFNSMVAQLQNKHPLLMMVVGVTIRVKLFFAKSGNLSH